jgi:hypothetical protein
MYGWLVGWNTCFRLCESQTQIHFMTSAVGGKNNRSKGQRCGESSPKAIHLGIRLAMTPKIDCHIADHGYGRSCAILGSSSVRSAAPLTRPTLSLISRPSTHNGNHQDRTLSGHESSQSPPYHQLHPQCMPMPFEPRPPSQPQPLCRTRTGASHASRLQPAERVCL